MKELSIEEKAKRYDDRLEKARKWYNANTNEGYKGIFEDIFPELKESEDERIRKEIMKFIFNYPQKLINRDSWLDWLEKQGEPQDKGEISDGYHTFNELYYYRMLYNAAFFNMLPKEWVHKSKKHHDGEDCFGGGWFIVMANLPTGQISNHYELKDWDLFQIPEKEVADKWDGHTPQEAANRLHKYLLEKQGEQKSLDDIVKKVTKDKDAAVSFLKSTGIINENGELADEYKIEKGEQKPTNNQFTSEQADILDKHIDEFIKQKPADKVEPKFKFGDRVKNKKSGVTQTLGSCIEDVYEGAFPFRIKDQDDWELVEQKPAWSEEDETMVNSIISLCDFKVNIELHNEGAKEASKKVLSWLNELKDRVQPQPKQEWSDVDKDILFRTIGSLKFLRDTISIDPKYAVNIIDIEREISWLKSLRPQSWTKEDKERYISCLQRLGTGNPEQPETINSKWFKEHVCPQSTWKPSEEQMETLWCATEKYLESDNENVRRLRGDVLESLYNDLKKLGEE